MCPVVPLLELTGGEVAKTVRIASDSARSPSLVLVPCALRYPMSRALSPASASARRMHSAAPEPSGRGVVGWCASVVAPQPTRSA